MGYLMSELSKTIVVVLFNLWLKGKVVHAFLKGISPKVNILAQLEFKLIYSDVAIQHVSLYTKDTTPHLCVL